MLLQSKKRDNCADFVLCENTFQSPAKAFVRLQESVIDKSLAIFQTYCVFSTMFSLCVATPSS